jgi:hypothetical protein
MSKEQTSWWREFIPADDESNEDWVDRMCAVEGYHFVMKEVTNMELAQLAAAYEIAKFRYAFRPGDWVILIIRDLIFCAYGTDFEQLGPHSA